LAPNQDGARRPSWALCPLDLGHNHVLADARCNREKADRRAAFDHLSRWCARNERADWTDALERRLAARRPHELKPRVR